MNPSEGRERARFVIIVRMSEEEEWGERNEGKERKGRTAVVGRKSKQFKGARDAFSSVGLWESINASAELIDREFVQWNRKLWFHVAF